MENGIKYNIDGGTVEVIVNRLSKEQVSLKIIDTVINIVDKSRSHQLGCAGLGLSTDDSIIKKHNGTITVTYNESNGTCFHVILNSGS